MHGIKVAILQRTDCEHVSSTTSTYRGAYKCLTLIFQNAKEAVVQYGAGTVDWPFLF